MPGCQPASPLYQNENGVSTVNREEAIGKINGEMQKSPDDRVLEAIGHYLIDRITDAEAEKVKGKTIAGAVAEMRREAQKIARGGVGVLTDEEGFAIVRRYFGLRDDAPEKVEDRSHAGREAKTPKEASAGGIDLDFDALWG